MGVWLACTLLTYFSAQNWVETPAHIVRTELKVQRGKSTTYEVTAEYVYQYGGQEYTGCRVGLAGGADNIGSFHQDAYRELMQCQQSKRPFRCYVNPAQPDQSLCTAICAGQMVGFPNDLRAGLRRRGLRPADRRADGAGKTTCGSRLGRRAPRDALDVESGLGRGANRLVVQDAMLAALAFAVFWNVVSSPLWLLLPREILDKGNRWALLGLVFPAVGLGLFGWSIYCVLRWRKFGQSVFQMASLPGVIGGQFAGVIRTSAKVRPEDGFHLHLRCVRRITTGSGKSRSTSERVLWEDQRVAMHELLDDQAAESAIPVEFQIPYDCQPSDDRNPDDQTLWRLTAAAEVPGIDYAATFEVPVFKTAQSECHDRAWQGRDDQLNSHKLRPHMKRYGMVLGLRAGNVEEYNELHAAVWPDVLRMIRECHIRNYSIFLRTLDDGQHYLFSYFEYVGGDFAPTWRRWRRIRGQASAGGPVRALPETARQPRRRGSGGPLWKKCSTRTDGRAISMTGPT